MKSRTLHRVWLVAWLAILASAGSPWLDVPYVQQAERTGCGPASIAMVMQYWLSHTGGLDAEAADADRIYALLSPSSPRGIRGQALKGYLEGHGFTTYVFNGELGDLRNHVEKGRPLVVCLAPRGAKAPLHYVVVVGLDASAVYFHDPARGKLLREEFKKFQDEWKATGSWTLLALPRTNS